MARLHVPLESRPYSNRNVAGTLSPRDRREKPRAWIRRLYVWRGRTGLGWLSLHVAESVFGGRRSRRTFTNRTWPSSKPWGVPDVVADKNKPKITAFLDLLKYLYIFKNGTFFNISRTIEKKLRSRKNNLNVGKSPVKKVKFLPWLKKMQLFSLI